MCLPVGSSQQLVVGGKQPGKVMEMIMSGRIVDWNSDVFLLGIVESFLAQHFCSSYLHTPGGIYTCMYVYVCMCVHV